MIKTFVLFGTFLTLAAPGAQAAAITFTGPAHVSAGSTFSVEIDINGISVPPGVAAFLVTVNYDAADLTLTNATEDAFLTDGGNFTDFSYTDATPGVGQVQVSDLSFTGPSPDSAGALFTLQFAQAAASTASSYTFSFVPYSAPGLNLEITDGETNPQDIIVDASNTLTVGVTSPEPATLTLVAAGAACVLGFRSRRRR